MTLETLILLVFLQTCAREYQVDPAFALAVAHVESGTRTEEFRFGRLGKSKYYGPFGIHRDFLKKWPIDNPYVNIAIGVRALRGKDKRRVLKRYNVSFNEAYYRAVCQAEKAYRRADVR